jgi:hypothetical protein
LAPFCAQHPAECQQPIDKAALSAGGFQQTRKRWQKLAFEKRIFH